MAEAVGLAVGVVALASLFTTCVDCWELFDNARVSDEQFELLATKLEVEKTRLLLWGDTLRIMDERPSDALMNTTSFRSVVQRILSCIYAVFEDSNILVERYGLVPAERLALETESVKRVTLSSRQMDRFKWLRKRLKMPAREERGEISAMKGARWAIRDRQKFGEMIEDLRQYIDELKDITETTQGPGDSRHLIYEEIQPLPDTANIGLLIKATSDTHQDWHDCATEVFEMSV